MTWITIRRNALLSLTSLDRAGEIRYDSRQHALVLIDPTTGEEELLTLNLLSSGYVAGPGEVFVKDWSEHSGLAAALVATRVVNHIESLRVGPHGVTAHRLQIVDETNGFEDLPGVSTTGRDPVFEDQLAAAAMRLAYLDQH
ncbi:hypothetical protein [Arthrobacter rhombi]|uniref:hypothetical protein n=1 Tax=Arthrobacter rhombi TaxID=71253 RepID=UPI003FBA0E12